ncbi:hypothetical protein C8J56DRAFT_896415 [Mycena floridula]|nr:hypothetical protein C8J56DRAFT_896415 [Mycena floridula]
MQPTKPNAYEMIAVFIARAPTLKLLVLGLLVPSRAWYPRLVVWYRLSVFSLVIKHVRAMGLASSARLGKAQPALDSLSLEFSQLARTDEAVPFVAQLAHLKGDPSLGLCLAWYSKPWVLLQGFQAFGKAVHLFVMFWLCYCRGWCMCQSTAWMTDAGFLEVLKMSSSKLIAFGAYAVCDSLPFSRRFMLCPALNDKLRMVQMSLHSKEFARFIQVWASTCTFNNITAVLMDAGAARMVAMMNMSM